MNQIRRFESCRFLNEFAGVAEWSGFGFPFRIYWFDSSRPLHDDLFKKRAREQTLFS